MAWRVPFVPVSASSMYARTSRHTCACVGSSKKRAASGLMTRRDSDPAGTTSASVTLLRSASVAVRSRSASRRSSCSVVYVASSHGIASFTSSRGGCITTPNNSSH